MESAKASRSGSPKRRPISAAWAAVLAAAAGCSETSDTPVSDPSGGSSPTVELLGPERLTKPVELRANARALPGSRVAAVSWFLDGRPLGSDTTKPYRLDVDPALLPQGRHRLRVEAVDSLGRRRSTKPSDVTVEASGSDIIDASPASFARSRSASWSMATQKAGSTHCRLRPYRAPR